MNSKSKRELKKEEKLKQENIRKLDEELRQRKKIPQDYKRKIRKQIILNVITIFVITLFLCSINIMSLYIETQIYLNCLRIISIVVAIIAIIYFELGYRKDNEKLFLYGGEILVLAVITLFSIYLYYMFFEQYTNILIYITVAFAIYYLIKILIIKSRMKKQYYKEQNDIKDIVKGKN